MRQKYLQSLTVAQAKSLWLESIVSLDLGTEIIASTSSVGRTTAEPVFAVMSAPHYASSAMDGLAVAASNTYGAAPGRPLCLHVGKTCYPVDTGDPLPAGTDAVIMVEHVVFDGVQAYIEQSVSPWQHVRPVGEDIIATELLLHRHHTIRPVDVGALLAASVSQVTVQRRPRVAVLPTGDELVLPGSVLHPGDIIEFNSQIIEHSLASWGCEVTVSQPIRDDLVLLRAAVNHYLPMCDVLIVLAGSSTGRGDFTAQLLREFGEVYVHGVAMRPGKPVILGKAGEKPVVGLPGYPVSAHLCLELFVRPLVYGLQRRREPEETMVTARLTRRVVSTLGVEEYVRVALGRIGSQIMATPLSRGAGVLSSLVKADGVMVVPLQSEGYTEGEQVSVRLQTDLSVVNESLVSIGSHDLSVDILADLLCQRSGIRLTSTHVGSMGGLLALKRHECHFAGVHLLDASSGRYNSSYVEKYFADEPMVLINLVGRAQGFIVKKDLLGKIRTWQDLIHYRFVNRQRGAGTRLLLDYHLTQEGLDKRLISGYDREEITHLAVACAVHAGEADVGLGILPAASAFGLSFVPLCVEQYDLLLHRESLKDPRVEALLAIIRSAEFATAVAARGGYDTSQTGQIVWQS